MGQFDSKRGESWSRAQPPTENMHEGALIVIRTAYFEPALSLVNLKRMSKWRAIGQCVCDDGGLDICTQTCTSSAVELIV